MASCLTGSGVSLETVCCAKSSDDPEDILLATSGWGGMISFFQVPCKSVVGADDNAESINNLLSSPQVTVNNLPVTSV